MEVEDVAVLVLVVNEISRVCMKENLWPEELRELWVNIFFSTLQ